MYVYRKHAEPGAWGTKIFFASKEVATLNEGGFTWAHVSPGELTVRVTWPPLSGQKGSQLRLRLEAGRTYFLEVMGVSRGFCVGLGCVSTRIGSSVREVDADAAPDVLEKCCKYQKASRPLY